MSLMVFHLNYFCSCLMVKCDNDDVGDYDIDDAYLNLDLSLENL